MKDSQTFGGGTNFSRASSGLNTTTTTNNNTDSLALSGDLADARTFNLAWQYDPHATTRGLPDLPTVGETLRGKPVYGLIGDSDPSRPGINNVRTQLDSGTHLSSANDGTITFGFFTHNHAVGVNNNPHSGEGKGYTPFTEAQKAAARIAVANWDELIAPEFQEVTMSKGASDWAKNSADIWLANTSTGPAQAWAYYPDQGQPYGRASSDVWLADPRYNSSNADLRSGQYGLQTLNHELGHSLGLSHPGDYDFGDDNDGDGQPDPITYEGDAFYFQDSHQYTIMSYFDSYETGNNVVDWNLMRVVYPSTPMVHDIWVIQQKYGVETTTRTGNTTYGFNATADVTNDAMRFEKGEMAAVFSIWDAGGNDTLNLSGFYTPSIIDLREGAYSSAGGFGSYDPAFAGKDPSTMSKDAYLAFVNANNTAQGFGTRTAAYDLYFGGREGVNEGVPWSEIMGKDWLMENNIGIAYGAVVENAIGGFGNDRINGNQANNQFTGGAGADVFVLANYSGVDATGKSVIDTSIDSILDFSSKQGDKIDVSSFKSVDAGDIKYVNGQLRIDTDGNGTADFFTNLAGAPTINLAQDFIYA
ncbi:M10 family metallopeptidase [Sphingomonas sp.]|uniref:M10 family metallopeptidase n=1 Tax=Sphingomonas sp. TaxID=28214 RepID=UPI002DF3BCC0|nr:M10 family metallopeptidase [Sphingomonas sp.]